MNTGKCTVLSEPEMYLQRAMMDWSPQELAAHREAILMAARKADDDELIGHQVVDYSEVGERKRFAVIFVYPRKMMQVFSLGNNAGLVTNQYASREKLGGNWIYDRGIGHTGGFAASKMLGG